MSGETDRGHAAEGDGEQSGILGNLPRTRPSVRSPRRKSAATTKAESEPIGSETAEPATDENAGRRPPGNEVEQLAKAGLTLAGGVASIGLKVAGRAASTLRETIERK